MVQQFTEEQLNEIATVFGLARRTNLLKVSDGYVSLCDKVWWHRDSGPMHQEARFHTENIKNFPELYSIKEPKTKVTYL